MSEFNQGRVCVYCKQAVTGEGTGSNVCDKCNALWSKGEDIAFLHPFSVELENKETVISVEEQKKYDKLIAKHKSAVKFLNSLANYQQAQLTKQESDLKRLDEEVNSKQSQIDKQLNEINKLKTNISWIAAKLLAYKKRIKVVIVISVIVIGIGICVGYYFGRKNTSNGYRSSSDFAESDVKTVEDQVEYGNLNEKYENSANDNTMESVNDSLEDRIEIDDEISLKEKYANASVSEAGFLGAVVEWGNNGKAEYNVIASNESEISIADNYKSLTSGSIGLFDSEDILLGLRPVDKDNKLRQQLVELDWAGELPDEYYVYLDLNNNINWDIGNCINIEEDGIFQYSSSSCMFLIQRCCNEIHCIYPKAYIIDASDNTIIAEKSFTMFLNKFPVVIE